jgi:hypothetical protein
MNVDNIKKLVGLVIEAGNVIPEMTKDAGSFSKFVALGKMGDELIAIAGLDVEELKKEVLDLDAAEKAELIRYIEDKFEIANDNLEEQIEQAIEIGIELMSVLTDAYNLWLEMQ